MACSCASTEVLTRRVCFPSALVNRSRTAFMCWAHYHGDGRDGNTAAARVWQATVFCHKPHISTSSSAPGYTLLILTARAGVCSAQLFVHLRFSSHLSPQQLSHADENAPQPLVDGQSRAGERLSSELNNDDLGRKQASGMSVVWTFSRQIWWFNKVMLDYSIVWDW